MITWIRTAAKPRIIVYSAFFAFALSLSGCGESEAEKEARLAAEKARIEAETLAMFEGFWEGVYNNSKGEPLHAVRELRLGEAAFIKVMMRQEGRESNFIRTFLPPGSFTLREKTLEIRHGGVLFQTIELLDENSVHVAFPQNEKTLSYAMRRVPEPSGGAYGGKVPLFESMPSEWRSAWGMDMRFSISLEEGVVRFGRVPSDFDYPENGTMVMRGISSNADNDMVFIFLATDAENPLLVLYFSDDETIDLNLYRKDKDGVMLGEFEPAGR